MTVMIAVHGIDTKAVMRILSVADNDGEGVGVDVGKDVSEDKVAGIGELPMVDVIERLSIVEVILIDGIDDKAKDETDSMMMELETKPEVDMLDEVISEEDTD